MESTEQRLIIGFYQNVTRKERNDIHKMMGATFVQAIKQIHADVVTVPVQNVHSFLAQYSTNTKVRYVEIDQVYRTTGCIRFLPDDPEFDLQWGLKKIMAPEAWCKAVTTPANIAIAILDTGIDQEHPDLASKITKNMNFTFSSDADDLFGHGTHVAGIAAAITNNQLFGAGTSFNSAELWNMKVLNNSGFGLASWIASGIVEAADAGASVINMSLGGPVGSEAIEDAVIHAWIKGSVIIASAGNDNTDEPSFPASYKNVISVAATDRNDNKAVFSNFGDGVDVAAPGVEIFSTCPNGPNEIRCFGFGSLSGTSMAAPFVSGLAALIKATYPSLNNRKIRQAVELSTDSVPGSGTLYKFGRINSLSAINKANTL